MSGHWKKTNHEKLQMVRELVWSFEIEEDKTKQILGMLEDALDLRAENEVASGKECYPDFVKMGDTTLRYEGVLDSGTHQYQRVAGNWFVIASYVDGKLVANSKHPYLNHIVNEPLIKCTEEEWREDNWEYATMPTYESIRQKLRWPKDNKVRPLAEDDEPPF